MVSNHGYAPHPSTLAIIQNSIDIKKKLDAAENPQEELIPALNIPVTTRSTDMRSKETAFGKFMHDILHRCIKSYVAYTQAQTHKYAHKCIKI